jgi:hypothetical protein
VYILILSTLVTLSGRFVKVDTAKTKKAINAAAAPNYDINSNCK